MSFHLICLFLLLILMYAFGFVTNTIVHTNVMLLFLCFFFFNNTPTVPDLRLNSSMNFGLIFVRKPGAHCNIPCMPVSGSWRVCDTSLKGVHCKPGDSMEGEGEDWSSSQEAEAAFFLHFPLAHSGYQPLGWCYSNPWGESSAFSKYRKPHPELC